MENKIKEILADVLMIDISELHDGSSPDTIESWDSLKQMNIIVALEEEFNLTFSDEQVIEMLNVALIINTIVEMKR